MNEKYRSLVLAKYVKVYEKKFEEGTLNDKDFLYLLNFTNVLEDSKSKDFLYQTVFRLKRWYPRFLIYFLLKIELKHYLKKSEASKNIQSLYKEYAKLIFNHAFRMYCRGAMRFN